MGCRGPTSIAAAKYPHGGSNSDELLGRIGQNAHQYAGSKKGFEAKAVKEGLYVRIDMPGVEKENVVVWREKKALFFIGKAPNVWEHELNHRVYGGSFDLSSDPGEVTEIKTDVQNGVLRMVLFGCGIQPEQISTKTSTPPLSSNQLIGSEYVRVNDYILLNQTFPMLCPPDKYYGFYPFQVGGTIGATEVKIIDQDTLFFRVDFPDVPMEAKIVKFTKDMVLFGGEGVYASEHDNDNRRYFGRFRLQCSCCKIVDVHSELKAGVLRMLAKKIKFKLKGCCPNEKLTI